MTMIHRAGVFFPDGRHSSVSCYINMEGHQQQLFLSPVFVSSKGRGSSRAAGAFVLSL